MASYDRIGYHKPRIEPSLAAGIGFQDVLVLIAQEPEFIIPASVPSGLRLSNSNTDAGLVPANREALSWLPKLKMSHRHRLRSFRTFVEALPTVSGATSHPMPKTTKQ